MRLAYLLIFLLLLFCGKDKEQSLPSIPDSAKSSTTNLETDDSPPPSTKSTKPLTLGPHIVDAPSGLMLRSEPNKNGTVIVKMLNGMKAEVLEYSQNEDSFEGNRARWAKVKYKKYTGWAFSYYLKPDKGAKPISE